MVYCKFLLQIKNRKSLNAEKVEFGREQKVFGERKTLFFLLLLNRKCCYDLELQKLTAGGNQSYKRRFVLKREKVCHKVLEDAFLN